MQIGIVGLGRMGAGIVRRLRRAEHTCVVFDRDASQTAELVKVGAIDAGSLPGLVEKLERPRTVWLMVPAAAVDQLIEALAGLLEPGDVLVDGGNSHYQDDIRRSQAMAQRGIQYLDVGVSGGTWGPERGYCLMIGGDRTAAVRLDPLFSALAPGVDAAPRTAGHSSRTNTAEQGYLYCGQSGAGHFVKMVHNGIEYGLMEAYAEGLNVLRHANAGATQALVDAETAPLRHPEFYQYQFPLADIAEVWRRGSVIASWLLDLTAAALARDPALEGYHGRVSDSGEGRWTLQAAIDESVPAPVLGTALARRFASRGEADYADRMLSALRHEFGGHQEKGS
jgi:6-phosphogluconate dehydrogenase